MADTTTSSRGARRRWPRGLLAVSLTLNLLIAGVILGAHLRDDREDRRFPEPDRTSIRDAGFAPFFDAMPPTARRAVGAALRERMDVTRPDRATLEAEFAEMLAALRTEPFAPAKLEAVMAAQHARASARIEAGRAALVEVIAGLSPAERAAFADRLEARIETGPERGAHRH